MTTYPIHESDPLRCYLTDAPRRAWYEGALELTDAEWADYVRVCEEYDAWQGRMGEAIEVEQAPLREQARAAWAVQQAEFLAKCRAQWGDGFEAVFPGTSYGTPVEDE